MDLQRVHQGVDHICLSCLCELEWYSAGLRLENRFGSGIGREPGAGIREIFRFKDNGEERILFNFYLPSGMKK